MFVWSHVHRTLFGKCLSNHHQKWNFQNFLYRLFDRQGICYVFLGSYYILKEKKKKLFLRKKWVFLLKQMTKKDFELKKCHKITKVQIMTKRLRKILPRQFLLETILPAETIIPAVQFFPPTIFVLDSSSRRQFFLGQFFLGQFFPMYLI